MTALGLEDVRPLWHAIKRLHDETDWPETKQGVAVRVAIFDLEQFCQAALTLLRTDLRSPAMSLMRGIYERSDYVLAASYDRKFAHAFIDADPNVRTKARTGDAMNVIRKILIEAGAEPNDVTDAMRQMRSFGSLHVHPSAAMPSFMLEEAKDAGGIDETLDSLTRSLAQQMLLALYQAAVAVERTAGLTPVLKQALATANTWSVEFGGFSIDAITGGDSSRVEYLDRN